MLSKEVLVNNDDSFQRFCHINMTIFNEHAQSKKTYARRNEMPFLMKNLSEEIITRFRLCNKFLNNKTEENRTLYVKQRNYCALLLRKTKKMYYDNLGEKSITHNRRFWKTVEPLLSDKLTVKEKINLSENGEILKTEWR